MNHRTNIIPLFLALCLFITGCSSSEQATGPAAEKESTVSQTAETDESVAATQSAETEDSKVSSELPSEGTSEDPQLLGKGQKQAETIAQPWLRQDLLTLDQEGRISLSANMNKISVRPDEELQGLHFTGPAAHFKGGRISVLGDFDLSGNPVGRISLSGITDSSHQVNVLFYLDEEEDPAAVLPLDHADGEDGWEGGYTHTIDVYGKIPAGSHKVSFEIDIEGAKGNEEADILIRHLEFSEASGIPVIYFKIDESRGTIADMNASPDHSARCYGTLDIQVPDNFVRDYPGGVSETVTDVAMDYVQGRGNSTWRDPDKKPYKFKLSKKTDLFGMGKNKNWALIANRFDNSLVRNRMTYWLGAAIGMEFTPQCIPVDVVMNDEYYGSYLLAENVKVDESRLAIDELTADDVQEPAVTGGYQLAMNPYYEEDPRSVFTTDKMIRFLNENPDFADEEGDDDFTVSMPNGIISGIICKRQRMRSSERALPIKTGPAIPITWI